MSFVLHRGTCLMRPGKSYKLHTNSPGHSFQNACFTWHERPVLRPHSGCLLQLLLYLRLRYCRFFIWSENPSKFSIWLSRRCNVARCSIRLIPMTSLMVLAPWQMRWSFVLHFNTLRLRQNGFNSKIGLRDCSLSNGRQDAIHYCTKLKNSWIFLLKAIHHILIKTLYRIPVIQYIMQYGNNILYSQVQSL